MARPEDIEARLAAYVDGELDAAGRAEIEQHLASNPQHRALIDELMQQLQLLRELPRVSAPPDVAETLNAQLERSVLLGNANNDADVVAMRIPRWGQLRAVAAVLVLVGGLAAGIVYLLPSPNREPELAVLTSRPKVNALKDAEEPTVMAGEPTRLETVERLGKGGVPVAGAEVQMQQQVKEADALVAAKPNVTLNDVLAIAGGAGKNMFNDIATTRTAELADHDDNSLVVVIPTGNAQVTNLAVASYLRDNGIAWVEGTEPMPAPVELLTQQRALASRLTRQRVDLKKGFDATAINQSAQVSQTMSGAPGGNTLSQVAESRGALIDDGRLKQTMNTGQYYVAHQLPRQRALEICNTLNSGTVGYSFDKSAAGREIVRRATSGPTTAEAEGETLLGVQLAAPTTMPEPKEDLAGMYKDRALAEQVQLPSITTAQSLVVSRAATMPQAPAPSTQPAEAKALAADEVAATSQPAPDLVNLVILVCPEPPTSQPAPIRLDLSATTQPAQ